MAPVIERAKRLAGRPQKLQIHVTASQTEHTIEHIRRLVKILECNSHCQFCSGSTATIRSLGDESIS